jgi:rhombotail lipoprotein
MISIQNQVKLIGAGLFIALIAGCMTQSNFSNSSVVDFLYPNQRDVVETAQIPVLTLPLRVGVAFTPGSQRQNSPLTENDKTKLMQEVSADFRKYDFVEDIEIIPSAYLRPQGSFSNLDQIRKMFNIDVIALLSFDQTRFTDSGKASFAYWTLVGAYLVPGEKNDTHTMIDAAVYDIRSHKMLFRAPGLSMVKSRATPFELSEQVREDAALGFQQASAELAVNLEEQLALFRERIKEAPEEIQIAHSGDYRGGGSLDFSILLLMLLLVQRLYAANKP